MTIPSRPRRATYTEKQFTADVLLLSQVYGWRRHHQRPGLTRSGQWKSAIQGNAGWPDLALCHERRELFLVAELKVGRNKPTPEQIAWLNALGKAGVKSFLWTPDDWPEIEKVLKGD